MGTRAILSLSSGACVLVRTTMAVHRKFSRENVASSNTSLCSLKRPPFSSWYFLRKNSLRQQSVLSKNLCPAALVCLEPQLGYAWLTPVSPGVVWARQAKATKDHIQHTSRDRTPVACSTRRYKNQFWGTLLPKASPSPDQAGCLTVFSSLGAGVRRGRGGRGGGNL